MKAAIEIAELRVLKNHAPICALPQWTVQRGERWAVVGANGCGKTTLLRVIAELERDYLGTCRVDAPHQRRVYVHPSPYFFQGSVLTNAAYGLAGRRMGRRKRAELALSWLERLGIAQLRNRKTSALSNGERKRLALARALAIEPSLLLLDEPLAELDESGIETICQTLMRQTDVTLVIAAPAPPPPELACRTLSLTKPSATKEGN